LEHDLFRKPVPTFRDHALEGNILLIRTSADFAISPTGVTMNAPNASIEPTVAGKSAPAGRIER